MVATTGPSSSDALFTPWSIGNVDLKHRIVLAPLTRVRADENTLDPNDMMVEYYEQRASDGGLLITEVSFVVTRWQIGRGAYDTVVGRLLIPSLRPEVFLPRQGASLMSRLRDGRRSMTLFTRKAEKSSFSTGCLVSRPFRTSPQPQAARNRGTDPVLLFLIHYRPSQPRPVPRRSHLRLQHTHPDQRRRASQAYPEGVEHGRGAGICEEVCRGV